MHARFQLELLYRDALGGQSHRMQLAIGPVVAPGDHMLWTVIAVLGMMLLGGLAK